MGPDSGAIPPAQLRVVDAHALDFATGRARLDEASRMHLGLRPGDLIEVTAGRPTLAIAWWAPPGFETPGTIHLDYIQRKNCAVQVDDCVTVRKVEAGPAEAVNLGPVSRPLGGNVRNEAIDGWAKEALLHRPVTPGDLVMFPGATKGAPLGLFSVATTDPGGPVVVTRDTTVHVGG